MKGLIKPNLSVGWLVLFVISITYSQKIHEKMNQREREEVFLSPNVPDYEIVSIHWPRLEKRDAQNRSFVQLRAFGEHIKLWLNPTEGILAGGNTPVYIARSGPRGTIISQTPINMVDFIIKYLYEDLSQAASLAVNNNRNGRRKITGVIGMKNIGIRPLPKRLIKTVEKYRRSLDSIPKSDYHDHHYHIAYKTAPSHPMQPLENVMSSKLRLKRFIPSVVYPEILVVIGYDMHQLFSTSIFKSVPYLLAFWNAVDMLYRNLENPKYRLNIAGFLIPQDRNALEYMANNIHSYQKLNASKAFDDYGKWLFKQDKYIPVNSYDAAITMTSYKMCYEKSDTHCEKSHVLGLAYPASMCDVSYYMKDMRKTGMIHDSATFDGILTAAHELGHLLGASHDGTEHVKCQNYHGYIMSSSNLSTNKSADWSNCSLSDFQSFLETNITDPTCIFNVPNRVGNAIPRYLPGKMMNADAQCQKLKGTQARIDETICRKLTCVFPNNTVVITGMPAADGTSCGNGKLCLHQECISEDEIN